MGSNNRIAYTVSLQILIDFGKNLSVTRPEKLQLGLYAIGYE